MTHFISQNTVENILNTIDKEREQTDSKVVLKVMKYLIRLGQDQGSKLLTDSMGYHGQIWLNKMESLFPEDFQMSQFSENIRNILDGNEHGTYENPNTKVDPNELEEYR